jgi:hypothetical protein
MYIVVRLRAQTSIVRVGRPSSVPELSVDTWALAAQLNKKAEKVCKVYAALLVISYFFSAVACW